MKKCKDCVHYEACQVSHPDLDLPFINMEKCRLFKDKTRFIELPCKVGEKIFDITMGKLTEKTVVSISFLLSKSVNHISLNAINRRDAISTIESDDIGKTVFLTQKEAEEKLKETKG